MADQLDIDAAQAVARKFFDEMAEWEEWGAQAWGDEEQEDPRRDSLRRIFDKYLSKKALKRQQSRFDSLTIQEPSEFAEAILEAGEAGKDSVWVYIPAGVVGGRARYLLVKEDGEWKIETRESDVGNAGRWAKEPDL